MQFANITFSIDNIHYIRNLTNAKEAADRYPLGYYVKFKGDTHETVFSWECDNNPASDIPKKETIEFFTKLIDLINKTNNEQSKIEFKTEKDLNLLHDVCQHYIEAMGDDEDDEEEHKEQLDFCDKILIQIGL